MQLPTQTGASCWICWLAAISRSRSWRAAFKISLAGISPHLKVLHEAGLATRRAEGRQRIYSLAPLRLWKLMIGPRGIAKSWQGRLKRLRSYLDTT